MNLIIRTEESHDEREIHALVAAAFGQEDEARLVDNLRASGDVVLSLVALEGAAIVGHILFSRLIVESAQGEVAAVALAPIAVRADKRGAGTGARLIEEAHAWLRDAGETLSIVLGDPDYYGRFGYSVDRAAGLSGRWSGPHLQALTFAPAPEIGRLRWPDAFAAL